MEHMPFDTTQTFTPATGSSGAVVSDWCRQLPVLTGHQVVLRQLRSSDAASLFAFLTPPEVARFISPPPSSIEGFEQFIAWSHKMQAAGVFVCFAVTLKHDDTAIGMFQVRQTEPRFTDGEWGFALGAPYWGTGVFEEGADLVLDFVFETLGVHRLEARASVKNGRGNRALQKIGAVPEGVLRRAFLRDGEFFDQVLYAIVEEDWRASRYARRNQPRQLRVH